MDSRATGTREDWVERELGGAARSRGYSVVTDSVRLTE
jgi:hypothetical protein